MHTDKTQHLRPQQPYLVLHADTYEHITLEKGGISHFYQFTVKDGDRPDVQAVPDGSVDLLFSIGEHDVHVSVGGTVLKVKQWPIDDTRLHFGVRFQPGKCVLPEGISIQDVVNTDITLDGDCYGGGFTETIAEGRTLHERALRFLKGYLPKAGEADCCDASHVLEQYVRRRIYESKGSVTIRELAQETAYSECYIRRIFGAVHGISPKSFEKFVRFQNVLHIMKRGGLTLEQTALECGYYDQSHMVKEFKDFSGVTPERYLNMISNRIPSVATD